MFNKRVFVSYKTVHIKRIVLPLSYAYNRRLISKRLLFSYRFLCFRLVGAEGARLPRKASNPERKSTTPDYLLHRNKVCENSLIEKPPPVTRRLVTISHGEAQPVR